MPVSRKPTKSLSIPLDGKDFSSGVHIISYDPVGTIANLRSDGSPVSSNITDNIGGGEYRPDDGPQGTIGLGTSQSPAVVMDALKHEILHKLLNGIKLPGEEGFRQDFHHPFGFSIGDGNYSFGPMGSPELNRLTQKAAKNVHLSTPLSEVPAYNSIVPNEQVSKPLLNSQDTSNYNKEFQQYLKDYDHQDIVDKILQMQKSQKFYTGTGLFPNKNIESKY